MALKRSQLFSLNGVTITNTEYSIPNAGTPSPIDTIPAAISLLIDGASIADGTDITVRFYEKVVSGGTQKCIHSRIIRHTQSSPWTFPEFMMIHGWDVTLQRTAGSDTAMHGRIEASTGSNITELYGRSNVTLGTEYGIVAGSTSLATKTDQPSYIQAMVYDRGNMVKGDEFEARIAEAVSVGGTKRTLWTRRIHDVQVAPLVSLWVPVRNGWEISHKKISATDRAFDLSIRGMT